MVDAGDTEKPESENWNMIGREVRNRKMRKRGMTDKRRIGTGEGGRAAAEIIHREGKKAERETVRTHIADKRAGQKSRKVNYKVNYRNLISCMI